LSRGCRLSRDVGLDVVEHGVQRVAERPEADDDAGDDEQQEADHDRDRREEVHREEAEEPAAAAERIAATIRVLCREGRGAGDILVLVRQRGPLFETIIRALKNAGVAVAGADLAQVFARHAVETVNGIAMIARRDQQIVKRSPVVSPIEIETDALPEFVLIDFAAPPLVQNVLVAGVNGFHSQYHGTIAGQRALLHHRCGVALRGRQCVIIADKDYVGGVQCSLKLGGIEQCIVAAKSLIKLAKIFAAAVGILRADFPFHAGEGVKQMQAMLSAPLRLTMTDRAWLETGKSAAGLQLVASQQERAWTLDTAMLASMLIVKQVQGDAQATLSVTLDDAKLSAFVKDIATQVNRPARDARFAYDDQSKTLTPLVASQEGRTLDVAATVQRIKAQITTSSRSVPLVVKTAKPLIALEDMDKFNIHELVVAGTTSFRGSSPERVHNVTLATHQFDGVMVAPGQEFSFNQYLGDVLDANGYEPAYVIIGDRTDVGIGGGVCQVSTTAFRAAFFFVAIQTISIAIVLTIVGSFFRGQQMILMWPWDPRQVRLD